MSVNSESVNSNHFVHVPPSANLLAVHIDEPSLAVDAVVLKDRLDDLSVSQVESAQSAFVVVVELA